jgi:hypothetical protein
LISMTVVVVAAVAATVAVILKGVVEVGLI